MYTKNLLTSFAIIRFLFGAGFILAPNLVTSIYGLSLAPGGAFIGQLLGVAFLILGMMVWFFRQVRDPQILRGLLTADFTGNLIGLVVFILALLNPQVGMNTLGWSAALIYLFYAVGSGYYLFTHRFEHAGSKPAA